MNIQLRYEREGTRRHILPWAAASVLMVAIAWQGDPDAHVENVTDASGNTYQPATSPTAAPGVGTQVLYYASAIAPAAAGAQRIAGKVGHGVIPSAAAGAAACSGRRPAR